MKTPRSGSSLKQYELISNSPSRGIETMTISVVTAAKADEQSEKANKGRWLGKDNRAVRDKDGRVITGLITLIGHQPRALADFRPKNGAQNVLAIDPGNLAVPHWPIRGTQDESMVIGLALPQDAAISDIAKARQALLTAFNSVSIELSMRWS